MLHPATDHIKKAKQIAIGTVASKTIESRFGPIAKYLAKHPGIPGWAAAMDVNNARKNLVRVIKHTEKQK